MNKDKKSTDKHLSKLMAVALQYEEELKQAPKVVAKGRGHKAERILELARENEVPISNDEVLTAALDRLDLEDEIPEELYGAVAKVLAYLQKAESEIDPRKVRI
jgi:flagellar biosynthesis protein